MGSRRGGDFRNLAGKAVKGKIQRVREALEQNKPASFIVRRSIDVLAASNPIIEGLVETCALSKFIYTTASKANEAYQKTGSKIEALRAVVSELIGLKISENVDQAVGNMVDVNWQRIKKASGIQTNETQDRILVNVTKNTLSEALNE